MRNIICFFLALAGYLTMVIVPNLDTIGQTLPEKFAALILGFAMIFTAAINTE